MLKIIFNFLSSITFTLIILGGIVLFTGLPLVAGKFAESYIDWLWLKQVSSLEFYGSKIFIILLVLFSINLLACCFNHLKRTLRFLKNTAALPEGDALSACALAEIIVPGSSAKCLPRAAQALKRCFAKPRIINSDSRQYLYAEKGRLAHFGFYLAHLSMLTLVIGIMVSTQGYHSSLDIAQGQAIEPLSVFDSRGCVKKLDFGLRCDDITVSYYEDGKGIKELSCAISILKGGKKQLTQAIDFSRALSYKGFDIFQNRTVTVRQRARISVITPGGQTYIYEKQNGDTITLPGTQRAVRALSFRPNSLQLISLSTPGRLWISHKRTSFADPELKGFIFRLEGFADIEMTNLKLIYDPAKKLVWGSFLAMIFGFFVMFYFPHLRLWIKAELQGDGCLITIAGVSSKNRQFLLDTAQRIREDLEKNT